MARTAVVGAGAWGTALAIHLARMDHDVVLWAHEPAVADEVNRQHENTIFLPRAKLPAAVRATSQIADVAGAAMVILVPPAQHLRAIAQQVGPALDRDAVVVVASKGIEESTHRLLSDVLQEVLPDVGPDRIAFLSGPSFAKEVARGLPTDLVIASHERIAALRAQPLLHAPLFRVYSSPDPIGVQIGGAIKNVIAIAAGACDGLKFGANARAALVTRGLAEITRMGVALGADPLTFLGMAGAGDLFLTCGSDLSRNRTLGAKLAEGLDAATYLKSQRSVAEGYYTAAAAHALAQVLAVEMPITEQVHAVLHEGRPLLEAIRMLLTRPFKDEQLGLRK